MLINNLNELNNIHIDVLREIGNIGSGNAATSISSMLGQKVSIDIPSVRIVDINDMADNIGGPENMVTSAAVLFDGDIKGIMMIIISNDLIKSAFDSFFPSRGDIDPNNFNDMDISMLKELSNIAVASYINAISDMTSLSINISVPDICVDMIGAILNLPFVTFPNISKNIIYISQNFKVNENLIDSSMLMIPDIDSLNKIMNSLGIQ